MSAIVATLATLLVTMTVTEVSAAINLNSSKSNVYRSTQNAQPNEGSSVEQTSTNTCNCPSDDETTTFTTEDTNTNTTSIECGDNCDTTVNQVNSPSMGHNDLKLANAKQNQNGIPIKDLGLTTIEDVYRRGTGFAVLLVRAYQSLPRNIACDIPLGTSAEVIIDYISYS